MIVLSNRKPIPYVEILKTLAQYKQEMIIINTNNHLKFIWIN